MIVNASEEKEKQIKILEAQIEELNNKKYQAGEIEFLQYKLNELKDYKYTIEEKFEDVITDKIKLTSSKNAKSFLKDKSCNDFISKVFKAL